MNWWLRSPNYNNTNNFCNVNTDGSTNNNNANNSLALLAGFYGTGSNVVAKAKDDLRKRRGTSLGNLKLPIDDLTRTLLAWRGMTLTTFHVSGQSSLDAYLQCNYAKGEQNLL